MKHGVRRPATEATIEKDIEAVWDTSGLLLVGLVSATSALILFAWLSEEVFAGTLQQFDFRARNFVHSYSNPQLTRLMQALTFLGSIGFLSVLFVILIIVFLAVKWRRPAIWLTVAVGGSVILDITLKLAFHRARPAPFFGSAPLTYSFPSGHALSSLCFYGVLAGLLSIRIKNQTACVLVWMASSVLVAGIGLSRIYLGVHYPTGVIAGYLAGTIWVSTLLVAAHIRPRGRRIAS